MAQTDGPTAAPGRLPLLPLLLFASVAMPLSAVGTAIAVYLPRHFAAHIGVSLAAVGGAFAIVRLLDIGVDLGLGLAMDRTKTRFGRYRAWLVAGAPILMAGTAALFLAPHGISVAYLIGWLLVLYLGTSIMGLSHTAWAANRETNYSERNRVFACLTVLGIVGAGAVLLLPLFAPMIGIDGDSGAVQAMGWFTILLAPIVAGLVFFSTSETINLDVHGVRFQLRDYWQLISRPTMARIMISDLCLNLGPGWMAAIYLFFFTDSRGFTVGEASFLLFVYVLAGLAGAPAAGWLANRIGKHRGVMVNTTGYSLMLMTILFLPKGNLVVAFFPLFICGFLAAGFNVLTRAMTADVADEVRLEQGKERVGLLFALTTLTTKISSAFAIWLSFKLLDMIGYKAEAGAVNTPEAIHGLELAYILGPIAFVMIGGACFIGYNLSADRHAEIRRQLDARDALYASSPAVAGIADAAVIDAAPHIAE